MAALRPWLINLDPKSRTLIRSRLRPPTLDAIGAVLLGRWLAAGVTLGSSVVVARNGARVRVAAAPMRGPIRADDCKVKAWATVPIRMEVDRPAIGVERWSLLGWTTTPPKPLEPIPTDGLFDLDGLYETVVERPTASWAMNAVCPWCLGPWPCAEAWCVDAIGKRTSQGAIARRCPPRKPLLLWGPLTVVK